MTSDDVTAIIEITISGLTTGPLRPIIGIKNSSMLSTPYDANATTGNKAIA